MVCAKNNLEGRGETGPKSALKGRRESSKNCFTGGGETGPKNLGGVERKSKKNAKLEGRDRVKRGLKRRGDTGTATGA